MDSTVVRIYDKHRLRIPADRVPDWTEQTVVVIVPLTWKRSLALPPKYQPEAWFFVPKGSEGEDWLVSPVALLAARGHDPEANELADMIFEIQVDGRNPGGWELLLPKTARDLAWLPSAKQNAILRFEHGGVSVWTETAFRIHLAGLATAWQRNN